MGTGGIAFKIAKNGFIKYPSYGGARGRSNLNFQDYNLNQILNHLKLA